MFKRGYKAVDEEVERSAQAQEMAGKKLFRFYMKADPKGKPVRAEVRFLTEEPIHSMSILFRKWVSGITLSVLMKIVLNVKKVTNHNSKGLILYMIIEHILIKMAMNKRVV